MAAFGVIGVPTLFALLGWLESPIGQCAAASTAAVFILPWFVVELLWPPPLELSAHATSVDYRFQDAQYASEFASLNGILVSGESSLPKG